MVLKRWWGGRSVNRSGLEVIALNGVQVTPVRLAVMGTPKIDIAILTQPEAAVVIDLGIEIDTAKIGAAALTHRCVGRCPWC
jgi:hypothetical protein